MQFKANPRGKPPPIPLENCPWCGERFGATSFNLLPNSDEPSELRVSCTNIDCDFSGDRALPIVAVDESIYRRLPAFLIATVDKFASLPWTAATGVLLGGADRHGGAGFYGASEPGLGQRLPTPLAPPDLVIQDELHLISGPLGTMVGLYEATIEALCMRPSRDDGRAVRPENRRFDRYGAPSRRTDSGLIRAARDRSVSSAGPEPSRLVLCTNRAP